MSEQEKTEKEDQGPASAQESAPSAPEKPPEDAPASDEEAASGSPTLNKRRSRWLTSLLAFRYVQSVSADVGIRIRDTDKATSIALAIATICLVLSPWINPLGKIRTNLLVVCDIFAGAVLVFYFANRFGIINTFSKRQALLTWQLILAAVYIGAFLTINLAFIIAFVVSNSMIQLKP
jgi:hypothetical protein